MRILEGEHAPDQGSIAVDGRPVRFASAREAHEAGIRIVHQEPEIIPELSVAENIFIGDLKAREAVFVDWARPAGRAAAMLARFGLERALEPRAACHGLGPAQRQLIEIMRALRPGVRLLCLDEPTSSLTEDEAQRLFAMIRALRADGVGIVYISHRLREVMDLADRVAVLRDGELVAVRDAAEVDEATMMRLMVGRDLGDLFGHRSRVRDEVALELRAVTTAKVRDCSLSVRAGEIVGLGGLVGAGRTELARAAFGMDRLRGGEIRVFGRRLALRAPADAILAGIGLVPEDRKQEALLLLRSVRDNVSLCVPREGLAAWASSIAAAESRLVSALTRRLGVRTPVIEQEVRKLSGGNQQKVVLRPLAGARAAHPDPGRADPRHRRRRQARDLPADRGAGRGRHRHPGHLLRAHRAAWPHRPDRRHARRLDRRRAADRHGDRGSRPRPGDGPARTREGRRMINQASAARPAPSLWERIVAQVGTQNLSLLLALVILVAIFGSLRPDVFFLPRNLVNIGLAITILGILAMAQTVVIVSGGLDISVGSIVGLATMVVAITMQATGSAALGIGAGPGCGGAGRARQRPDHHLRPGQRGDRDPGHDGGVPRLRLPHLGRQLGQHRQRAVPLPRQRRAAVLPGADPGPARRCWSCSRSSSTPPWSAATSTPSAATRPWRGSPASRSAATRSASTSSRGVAAGIAGLLLASRTMSGQPASGSQGLELEAITAAILGGCALQGGKGTIFGALLGVLIIGVLNNGLILTSVPTFYQLIAKGALLIVAVMIQERQLRRAGEA